MFLSVAICQGGVSLHLGSIHALSQKTSTLDFYGAASLCPFLHVLRSLDFLIYSNCLFVSSSIFETGPEGPELEG